MPSILVCVSPTESHVGPTLEVARAFVEGGWRVRVLTSGRFANRVHAVGAAPLALPPEADLLDSPDSGDSPHGVRAINDGIFRTFFGPADVQFRCILDAIHAEPVDVIGGDFTFTGMLLLNTLPARPAIAAVGILPVMLSGPDVAPFGLGIPPLGGVLGRLRNRTLTWAARRVVLRRVQRQVDGFLRDRQLPGLGTAFFADCFYGTNGMVDLFGQLTVPDFEYPRSDLPGTVQFFGPVQAPPADTVLPDWWHELDGSRPVVHVSQGTVANADIGELVAPTLSALEQDDVLVVVTTGRTDGRAHGTLPPLPANARAADFLPYDQLLPRVSAFVTNGGYGGLSAAMSHGVPIVVAGDTQDKVETSARVAWSGVGVNLRTGRPRPAAIRQAVTAVLTTPSYREASVRMAAAIAASSGARGFVHAVEELVERRCAQATGTR